LRVKKAGANCGWARVHVFFGRRTAFAEQKIACNTQAPAVSHSIMPSPKTSRTSRRAARAPYKYQANIYFQAGGQPLTLNFATNNGLTTLVSAYNLWVRNSATAVKGIDCEVQVNLATKTREHISVYFPLIGAIDYAIDS
jgi:hypothetical protein